jgi:hypothetical protein
MIPDMAKRGRQRRDCLTYAWRATPAKPSHALLPTPRRQASNSARQRHVPGAAPAPDAPEKPEPHQTCQFTPGRFP